MYLHRKRSVAFARGIALAGETSDAQKGRSDGLDD
jgi:hypothetical protein